MLLALVLATWFRMQGLGRSLWLDEAWVANSVLETTVPRMLFYDAWVPSPEPGFLLTSRLVTSWLGPSSLHFRIVPLAFSLIGLLAMLLLLRCLFPTAWTVFGFALFAMSPTAILYAHSFKHYSTQLAMAPILLLAAVHCNRRPGPRNFALLLAAILVTALFSYPTVLLLPAVVILVGQPQSGDSIDYSRVRQGIFAALWGLGVFGLLYVAVIRHNINAALRVFFANPAVGVVNHLSRAVTFLFGPYRTLLPIPERLLTSTGHPVGLVAGLGLIGVAALFYQRERPSRRWLVLAVVLPQLAAILLDTMDRYPAGPRTMLFLLPCDVILVTSLLESVVASISELAASEVVRRRLRFAAPVAAVLILGIGCSRQRRTPPPYPDDEDMAGAVAWLKSAFHDGDALYVHTSVQEEFKLYSRILGFAPPAAQLGNTGWPCCPRHVESWKHQGSVDLVEKDITRLYPVSLPARLWELHTRRPEQWTYIGLDEGKVLQALFIQRGCTLAYFGEWRNLAVSRFNCPTGDKKDAFSTANSSIPGSADCRSSLKVGQADAVSNLPCLAAR